MRLSVASGCQECHWSFTRDYPQLVASTTMWEIETNSVGSGSDPGIVGPGQVRYVGSPPELASDLHPVGVLPSLLPSVRVG